MPRILVTTDAVHQRGETMTLSEHVAASDLASAHFAAQLIERLGWAVADAEGVEHAPLAAR
jgi:hypothetical protein